MVRSSACCLPGREGEKLPAGRAFVAPVAFAAFILLHSLHRALTALKDRDHRHFGSFTEKGLLQEYADLRFRQEPTALQQKIFDELGLSGDEFREAAARRTLC